MADTVVTHNIGAFVVVATSVQPQSGNAGTINGGSIDRMAHGMPMSCVLHTQADAVSGSPIATSVQSTLQRAPDNSTWANYTDPSTGAVATAAALTAANSETASMSI